MELKEGMYVRTKHRGIKKIIEIGEFLGVKQYLLDDETNKYIIDNSILKASYNIIDLIKVGDYVDGYKITGIIDEYYDAELDDVIKGEKRIVIGNEEGLRFLVKKDIKSIVTKEQFTSMQYEVSK